ncbi:MAG: hypothetical protein NC393_04140 [Clostridium sp.]|nr:hypothetical protein [Clostridium sp.]MCM1208961.1 hypothetical protein [Ruminococcus sp.]
MKRYEEIAHCRNTVNEITGCIMYDHTLGLYNHVTMKQLTEMCKQDLVRYLVYDVSLDEIKPYYTNDEIADMGNKVYKAISEIDNLDDYFSCDFCVYEEYVKWLNIKPIIIAAPNIPMHVAILGDVISFILMGDKESIDRFIAELPSNLKSFVSKPRTSWTLTLPIKLLQVFIDSGVLDNFIISAYFLGLNQPTIKDMKKNGVLKNFMIKDVSRDGIAYAKSVLMNVTNNNIDRMGNAGSMNLF